MKQVVLSQGKIIVEDVPVLTIEGGEVLVKTALSLKGGQMFFYQRNEQKIIREAKNSI